MQCWRPVHLSPPWQVQNGDTSLAMLSVHLSAADSIYSNHELSEELVVGEQSPDMNDQLASRSGCWERYPPKQVGHGVENKYPTPGNETKSSSLKPVTILTEVSHHLLQTQVLSRIYF
jgi:hypothetical protein